MGPACQVSPAFGGLRSGWDQVGVGSAGCQTGAGWRCANFICIRTRCAVRVLREKHLSNKFSALMKGNAYLCTLNFPPRIHGFSPLPERCLPSCRLGARRSCCHRGDPATGIHRLDEALSARGRSDTPHKPSAVSDCNGSAVCVLFTLRTAVLQQHQYSTQ